MDSNTTGDLLWHIIISLHHQESNHHHRDVTVDHSFSSLPLLQKDSLVVPGGGVAVSGQHQSTSLNMGLDQGEGLNGWLTLFQLSSKALGPLSSTTKTAVAHLTSQCTDDMEGDLISWKKTPRKGHGGATETPSQSKVCGVF